MVRFNAYGHLGEHFAVPSMRDVGRALLNNREAHVNELESEISE